MVGKGGLSPQHKHATRPCHCLNICLQTDEWGKNTLGQNELQVEQNILIQNASIREELISEGRQHPSRRWYMIYTSSNTLMMYKSNQQPLLLTGIKKNHDFGNLREKWEKKKFRVTKKQRLQFTYFHCFYYTSPFLDFISLNIKQRLF